MDASRITVNCSASYQSVIAVPAGLSLEDAIGYARAHIRDIPLGRLEWMPDSDEIDAEGCSFAVDIEAVIPITLIRTRRSEGESWADDIYLSVRPGEDPRDPGALLRKRAAEYLLTPEGRESNRVSCFDYNWGDLIMDLPVPGIAARPGVSAMLGHVILSVSGSDKM